MCAPDSWNFVEPHVLQQLLNTSRQTNRLQIPNSNISSFRCRESLSSPSARSGSLTLPWCASRAMECASRLPALRIKCSHGVLELDCHSGSNEQGFLFYFKRGIPWLHSSSLHDSRVFGTLIQMSEKDIDEVLQSHIVYTNVSKGVLAKSKDLIAAFGTDDQEKVCLEILEKGELQVSGREREAHLSSQFRDIATIVMQKTVNPQTQRPYTISMIERLMREIHFALEPNNSSKKQALELIKELEKQFPIIRAKMRLLLLVPNDQGLKLTQKLDEWNSFIEQTDGSNNMLKVVCQLDPGHFRECDAFVRDSNGKLEVMAMAVQKEGDGNVDEFVDDSILNPSSSNRSNLSNASQSVADKNGSSSSFSLQRGPATVPSGKEKQRRCTTCNAEVGDALQHREHFKSDWHKHNLKRKVKQLPPLSAEDWHLDTEILEDVNDMNDYSR